MNKRQWFASTDPEVLLRFLKDRAGERKLRLFAVACGRRFWSHLFRDASCLRAVETAERFADGGATVRECRIARATTGGPGEAEHYGPLFLLRELARAAVKSDAYGAALDAARRAIDVAGTIGTAPVAESNGGTDRAAQQRERVHQIASLRCIFGNPFRPTSVEPDWLTSDVLALARGIDTERAFERAPILADALQDAGCTNEDLLKHLRCDTEHVRGCWALDLVPARG
ncbi:MAG TPA: hypothetical protein VGE74_10070 [Gemmata sp.]